MSFFDDYSQRNLTGQGFPLSQQQAPAIQPITGQGFLPSQQQAPSIWSGMWDGLKNTWNNSNAFDKTVLGPNNSQMLKKGFVSPMIQGASALGNIWMANQQLQLARDNNRFQRASVNRDIENQGRIVNSDIFNRQQSVLRNKGMSQGAINQQLNDDWKKANFVNTNRI